MTDSSPDRLEVLERELRALREEVDALHDDHAALARLLGRFPTPDDTTGSGLAGMVARIDGLLGEAPNDATGAKGSGLAGTVAQLVRLERARARRLAVSAAGGGGGVALLFELVWRYVLPALGG